LKEVKDANAKSLAEVKADNQQQLEKMRETVDEKLSSTLEKRFNQSFELVNKRLEEINRTFTELQSLQSGVNDLNKIFKTSKRAEHGAKLRWIVCSAKFSRASNMKNRCA
jgi:DNA recombination protein RmuC